MEVEDLVGIISYGASNSTECLTEQKIEDFGIERSVKYRRTNPQNHRERGKPKCKVWKCREAEVHILFFCEQGWLRNMLEDALGGIREMGEIERDKERENNNKKRKLMRKASKRSTIMKTRSLFGRKAFDEDTLKEIHHSF